MPNSRITPTQALEALDAMDDFARMEVGVDAHGPRETLRKFIEQASATSEIAQLCLSAIDKMHVK